jgi:hypothetical protein
MSFTEAMRCGGNDQTTHPSSVGGYKNVVCCISFFHRRTKLQASYKLKELQIGIKGNELLCIVSEARRLVLVLSLTCFKEFSDFKAA